MASDRYINELQKLATYEERLEYLRVNANIGVDTFGFDRYLNQQFYHSKEWKRVRDIVIVRDKGCDLGCEDRPIPDRIYIHHMNPISQEDIFESSENLLNPDYLVCCSLKTHNAIHYGVPGEKLYTATERTPNDTCPWK